MKYLIPTLLIFLFNGCTDTPTPQSGKEIKAKEAIATNLSEAEKARSEYSALQEQRKKESTSK